MRAIGNKTKKMTIEDLAAMTQRGFGEIKKNTATKEELASMEKRLKTDITDLKKQLSAILSALDKTAKDYSDYSEEKIMRDAEIARLKKWVQQIAKEVGVKLE